MGRASSIDHTMGPTSSVRLPFDAATHNTSGNRARTRNNQSRTWHTAVVVVRQMGWLKDVTRISRRWEPGVTTQGLAGQYAPPTFELQGGEQRLAHKAWVAASTPAPYNERTCLAALTQKITLCKGACRHRERQAHDGTRSRAQALAVSTHLTLRGPAR
jgi:hypothetical protein